MRRDAIQAIKFGLTMSDDVVAVHVTDDLEEARAPPRAVPSARSTAWICVVVESPYRELVQPLVRYLEMLRRPRPTRSW